MKVVRILQALSKISLIPWQMYLVFYTKNTDDVNTMVLKVKFALYMCMTWLKPEETFFHFVV